VRIRKREKAVVAVSWCFKKKKVENGKQLKKISFGNLEIFVFDFN
jgi:hypothetical protein